MVWGWFKGNQKDNLYFLVVAKQRTHPFWSPTTFAPKLLPTLHNRRTWFFGNFHLGSSRTPKWLCFWFLFTSGLKTGGRSSYEALKALFGLAPGLHPKPYFQSNGGSKAKSFGVRFQASLCGKVPVRAPSNQPSACNFASE